MPVSRGLKKNPHKPLRRAVSEKQFYKLYFRYDIIIIIIYFDIFDSANAMYTLFRITANIIRGTRDLKIKLVFLFLTVGTRVVPLIRRLNNIFFN